VSGVEAAVVRERLSAARAAIAEAAGRAGRDSADVALLAAVKYVGRDDLPALAEAGIELVGENRADALAAKQPGFEDAFTWDFIGNLQSRKVREVVGRVRLVHAVHSESVAQQIDARAQTAQDVLVEVNVARDPAKFGVLPAELDGFLELLATLTHVRVRGLMTMPAFATDPEASRAAFAELRELAAAATERHGAPHGFDVLSMGTSQDYLVAVEEGATIVRLGSALYGRPLA